MSHPFLSDGFTYLNQPSVLTLMSCRTNHIPIFSEGSVSRAALHARLPIRFRVYMPLACDVDKPGPRPALRAADMSEYEPRWPIASMDGCISLLKPP